MCHVNRRNGCTKTSCLVLFKVPNLCPTYLCLIYVELSNKKRDGMGDMVLPKITYIGINLLCHIYMQIFTHNPTNLFICEYEISSSSIHTIQKLITYTMLFSKWYVTFFLTWFLTKVFEAYFEIWLYSFQSLAFVLC